MSSSAPSPQIGGMALSNGLLVHGRRNWAVAVQNDHGGVSVHTGRKLRLERGPLRRVPFLRGAAKLAEAIAVLPAVKRAAPEARFAMEETGTAVALLASAGVGALVRRRVRNPLVQDLSASVAGIAPMLLALRSSPAATWHSVEHKSIAAYESGGSAEIARAADHAKEHERCGSNLVVPLMLTGAVANSVGHLLRRRGPAARAAMGIAAIGGAVEIFAFATRSPAHPISRVVHGAGRLIQTGFATREPAPEQLAVGRAAMDALLAAELSAP